MNILFVTHYSDMLGANKSLLAFLLYLKNNTNYNPIVLLPCDGDLIDELQKHSISYFKCRIYPSVYKRIGCISALKGVIREFLTLLASIYIYFLLKDRCIKLIHSNSSVSNAGAYLSKMLKTPHIWHFREFVEQHYKFSYNWGRRYQYFLWNNSSDVIIAISGSLKKYYSSILFTTQIVTIYNGVEIGRYLRNEHNNLNASFFDIALVGVVHPGKHQDVALRAISEIVNGKSFKNIHLHIYGGFIDKQYEQFILMLVEKLKIRDYVTFYGYQSDVLEKCKNFQIGILASEYEAFGRVTIEYMATGLLPVVSNSGANSEIVTNGENGFLFELNNEYDLANKIYNVINNYQSMGILLKNAYNTALKFTVRANALHVISLYDKMLI